MNLSLYLVILGMVLAPVAAGAANPPEIVQASETIAVLTLPNGKTYPTLGSFRNDPMRLQSKHVRVWRSFALKIWSRIKRRSWG
jgi:hypothetical protein